MFPLIFLTHSRVTEWIGDGLQNLIRQFESAPDVKFSFLSIVSGSK